MKKQPAVNKLDFKIVKFILGTLPAFTVGFILQINVAVVLFLILLVIYLKTLYKDLGRESYKLLNLVLLFVINFVVSYFVIIQRWPLYYIPFCVIPMLATVLFNELAIAFVITIASSVAIASAAGSNFYLGVVLLTTGVLSSLLVYGARQRVTIVRAGFIIGLAQALLVYATLLSKDAAHLKYSSFVFLIVNGIACGGLVLEILPVFEFLFDTITNVRLLELADFNRPLLNRMMVEAPGTYHHSLIVGNLSEAACNSIGAHSLLARIGAYYHDIGKLNKPEYFSENQSMIGNKHDDLSPTMSKLVIMNHIKDGIELAKKSRLNKRIINFIAYHHGNSLVYYFYRRALENLEEDQEIKEEGFRYPGPKPNTKETAVVMLADSVEAATRALKEPVPSKIEEVVHKIINNKFIDGQLDECDLTLKDLEKISSVFIRILSSIYHARISYSDENSPGSNKKSPKEDSHQSQEGREARS